MGEYICQPQKRVLVIGHRNPDSDSVCSAIAYAYLKNQLDTELCYVPCRAGEVNNETKFVLNYFGVDLPEYMDDVRPQMEDVSIRRVRGVNGDLSMRDAWNLMRCMEANTLAIVDDENYLQGLITMTDVATANMDASDVSVLSKAKPTYESIVATLDGDLVVGDPTACVEEGKICVAAGDATTMVHLIEVGDTVILSNRVDSQRLAIELGVGCMVVTGEAEIPEHIRHMARSRGIVIISTPHDSYTAARLISQSAPVSYFMTKENLLTFHIKDMVEDAQQVMVSVRHRYFPVLDEDGHYYGMVSRRNMMDMQNKQLILVDHNELAQAVYGIQEADVLEIIDHHRLGSGLQTTAPIYFRNQPVGCTGTIVYQMYQENGIQPPPAMAGMMCSAILSDTLAFRSPTCTAMDQAAAEALAELAGIDLHDYADAMFEAGADLEGKTAKDVFYMDFKPFSSGDIRFGIGQSSFMSDRSAAAAKELLLPYLEEARKKEELDLVCYMLTNILTETTELIFSGPRAKGIVSRSFPEATVEEHSAVLADVVSRKKQMVPNLSRGIAEWQNNRK